VRGIPATVVGTAEDYLARHREEQVEARLYPEA
jgi:hypothetical protein